MLSNEISTSINILNEKDNEIEYEKDYNNKNKEIDDRITIEDLTNIMSEPFGQEKKPEIMLKREDMNGNLSKEEMIENELSIIKKQNLSKYLMVNGQFKSDIKESEDKSQNEIKPKKCKLYKYVGRTLFIFLDKYENPLLIIGPHWPMYLCFCGIVSIIMLGIYLTLWKQIGIIMRILGHICYWTYFISYSYCSLCNPGYPKNDIGRKFGEPREEYIKCTVCHFYVKKSRNVHHCYDCNICIENQDHHCPWTGHCIGKNNIISFYIFVTFSFLIIIYLAFAICIGASQYN